MCNRKTLFTLWLGGTIGFAMAAFFAQEKGSDLRKRLQKSKDPVRDVIVEAMKIKLDCFAWIKDQVEKK